MTPVATSSPSKQDVRRAFQLEVADQLGRIAQMTAAARDEATGQESASEGKYDTRATEASYLAAGHGRRMAALKQLAAWLDACRPVRHDAVRIGSLVGLEGPRGARWVWVGPAGGAQVEVGNVSVQLISLHSPLGRQLRDARVGDDLELETPRGLTQLHVVHVS